MEPESKLIRRVRLPFALRHPRWFAGVWFGVLGAVPGLLILAIGCEEINGLGEFSSIVGSLSAFLAGAKYGRLILSEGMKGARAVEQAALVVGVAHLLFTAIPGIGFAIFAAVSGQWWVAVQVLLFFLVAGVITTIAGAIVTLPIGCFGGWLLATYRKRIERPSGCLIHGYRSDTTYGAEQNVHNRIRADL